MEFTDVWNRVVVKNPDLLKCDEVSITPEKLKSLMQQSYVAGAAAAAGKKSLFEEVFGGDR